MQSKILPNPGLYVFEKFDVGVIHLDAKRKVLAMNDYARRVLPVDAMQPFDQLVTSFHPERSRSKVKFLLDEASACPMSSALPMTMIINIPEKVLLIKVSRLGGAQGETTGFVLVFYDVTPMVSQEHAPSERPIQAQTLPLRLLRIPVVSDQKVSFIDAQDVLSIESKAHFTRVQTRAGQHVCNLSIGDLALRLEPGQFMRVHRCFIVNTKAVHALEREGAKTYLVLIGKPNQQVPVSRSEVPRLREALGFVRSRKQG